MTMWRGSWRHPNSFVGQQLVVGAARAATFDEQTPVPICSKLSVVSPIRADGEREPRVHRRGRRGLHKVEQRAQLPARHGPRLLAMEQRTHMRARRRDCLRRVEQRGVLSTRGRSPLLTLEQWVTLRLATRTRVC